MDEQWDRLLQIEKEKIEINNAEQEGTKNGTKEECGVTDDESSGKGIGEGEVEKVTHCDN